MELQNFSFDFMMQSDHNEPDILSAYLEANFNQSDHSSVNSENSPLNPPSSGDEEHATQAQESGDDNSFTPVSTSQISSPQTKRNKNLKVNSRYALLNSSILSALTNPVKVNKRDANESI